MDSFLDRRVQSLSLSQKPDKSVQPISQKMVTYLFLPLIFYTKKISQDFPGFLGVSLDFPYFPDISHAFPGFLMLILSLARASCIKFDQVFFATIISTPTDFRALT